ncbi:hypothetical protein DESA109040_07570 [Deinococcus saxicola]|uniref:hypothetical protein n=1 Tax=Deinococcus saxicola TaxID=249406 RepID=UPI0039EF0EA8
MIGTATQDRTPDADKVASPSAPENVEQAGSEHINAGAKQNASSTRKQASVRYLSDFISDIPDNRRMTFIIHLKAAIRDCQFDGSPIHETFALKYTGRGSTGAEKRQTDQRDFVVDNTAAFGAWLANEAQEVSTRPKYPTRTQLEGGEVNLAEMADKFRQRGGSSAKRKARR